MLGPPSICTTPPSLHGLISPQQYLQLGYAALLAGVLVTGHNSEQILLLPMAEAVKEGGSFDLANDNLREVLKQLVPIAIAFFCLIQELFHIST